MKIFSSGRLHPKKNQRVLLELCVLFPDVDIRIAGAGELRHEFSKFIEENGLGDQ